MKPQERAKQLAAAHWGYIEKLLEAHGYNGDSKDIIGFHYRTAMEHGHGHGVEDERNGMFDTEGAAAIADVKRDKETPAGYLCHSCQRNVPFKCHGEYLMTKDGGCEGYVSALRENMLDAKNTAPLCISCGVQECEAADAWRNICSLYVTKQEAPTAAVLPSTHTDPSTNCKDCFNTACVGKGRNLTCDQGCERFIPKELAHDEV